MSGPPTPAIDLKNVDTALRWWRQAAQAGNDRALFNVAVTAERRGDLAGAEDWYRRAAEAGNDAAVGNLGVIVARRATCRPPSRDYTGRQRAIPIRRITTTFFSKLGRHAEAELWLTSPPETGDWCCRCTRRNRGSRPPSRGRHQGGNRRSRVIVSAVSDGGAVLGDEPLVDGMNIAVRIRRDFIVADADRLLAAARRMYRELHPGTSADTAAVMVTCAADALYLVLEHVGLLGHVLDGRLARYESDGLTVAGWRAETTINEPNPLRPGPDCLRTEDVFALPPRANQP